MCYLFITLLIISQICLADNKQFVTFKTINDSLTEQQKAEIPSFNSLIENALKGDISSKTSLAFLTYVKSKDKKLNKIGLMLYQDIYTTYGYDLGSERKNEFIQVFYDDLASAYLNKELFGIQPHKAYKLIIENAKHNTIGLSSTLEKLLTDSNYIPIDNNLDFPELLLTLWLEYDNNKPDISLEKVFKGFYDNQLLDMFGELEPDESLFKSCNGSLGQMDELVSKYKSFQNQILTAKDNQDEILKQAKVYFSGFKTSLVNQVGTFNFSDMNIQSFMDMILFDQLESMKNQKSLKLKMNQNLYNKSVEIFVEQVPYALILARLLNTSELELVCHEEWVMLKPKSNMAVKYLITGSFQVENTSWQKDSQVQGTIRWDDGTIYKGSIENNLPEGQGRYKIPARLGSGDFEIVGNFIKGILNGEGQYLYTQTKSKPKANYIGAYKNGLYHGKGQYIDPSTKTNFKGNFINGKFIGKSQYYFKRELSSEDEFILYEGEFKESLPHGIGVCSTKEFEYDCQFYKGYIIGIGGFSLLPEYIK